MVCRMTTLSIFEVREHLSDSTQKLKNKSENSKTV